jgi:hypothetical protein
MIGLLVVIWGKSKFLFVVLSLLRKILAVEVVDACKIHA